MRSRKRKHRNRNRAWDAPAQVVVASVRMAVLGATVVMGIIVYAILQHNNRAINREIADLESDQRRLVEELGRARSQWAAMRTPRHLEQALVRHGIVMEHPGPLQIVAMSSRRSPGDRVGAGAGAAYASR